MKKLPKDQLLLLSAVATASLGAISAYHVIRKRKQDQLAYELMKELSRLLHPSTTGLLAENAFDTDYKDEVVRNSGRQILTLRNEVAGAYADQLHAAWRGWWLGGDNEKAVYQVFRELKDKVQVSQVADAYLKNHQQHLIDKLNERLDDEEINRILAIVRPLPAFRTV